ncbi:MAG TPA: amidohydrolase family protein [Acidimicrobiales bacterium]|nr:amidohydrolase family protein [Acidimicrobiales bacterium]
MLDTIVRGGLVVDGTGAPARRADVGVADGRVVDIGDIGERGRSEIDAATLVVAPGFIDLHTHYDAQLFWDPWLTPSPLHGVTTVVAGNCGLTLAPVAPRDRDFLTRLLARVESIPGEAITAGVKFSWESFEEFLAVVDAKEVALNIGFMVGHSAIRRAVMGERASTDRATAEELQQMEQLLSDAIGAGGLGFSTANVATQVDGDGRPTPPNSASREELVALSAVCGRHPGTSIEFIPDSFLRGFSDDDVALMADMSAAADRPLNWNTPLVNRLAPDLHRRQLEATDVARGRGGWVVPMFMPQNGPLQHDFLRGYVFRAIPGWSWLFELDVPERMKALADPDQRRQLASDADAQTSGLALVVRNWASYRINEVHDPDLEPLVGRTVADLAVEWSTTPFDAMVDVALRGLLDVGFVRSQYADDDRWAWEARLEVLRDPRVVLGASDAGAHMDMMTGADFPTRCMAELVRERGAFTLEELVHRFTDVPARLYGIKGRGRLEEGAWADLVLFDPEHIGATPLSTVHDLPAGAPRLTTRATGVQHVLVAGQPVVKDGGLTQQLPGRLLRSGRDTETVRARGTEAVFS